MEVRGSVTDRPWGLTLGAIARRRHTGQLTIESDGKRYCVAFGGGAIVAATSPVAADAITRVALTHHVITAAQVADLTRRLAQAPDRDEVEVLGNALQFSPAEVEKLRRRLVAQRAARTFSLEHGDFVLDDRIKLPVFAGMAIDHRLVIYLGTRTQLPDHRLVDDLRRLGSHFVLAPEAIDELSRFGFEPGALPVLEALRAGTSLPELEGSHRGLDLRLAQAVIYALVSCGACEISPRPATQPMQPTQPTPPSGVARTATATPTPRPRVAPGSQDPQARPPPPSAPPPQASPAPPAAQGITSRAKGGPTTTSLFAPRTSMTSPTAYSGTTAQDMGTNTPAAMRPRGPATARTLTPVVPATARAPTPVPASTARAPTPVASSVIRPPMPPPLSPPRAMPPAAGLQGPVPPAAPRPAPAATTAAASSRIAAPAATTTATLPVVPAAPPSTARTDTADGVRLTDPAIPTPSPLAASSAKHRAVTFGEPQARTITSDADVVRSFADQRTPSGILEQRMPGLATQRTPTDPAVPGPPAPSRVSTDTAVAAEEAFKRGERAMKRDQPGEAILEYKTACDLNPYEVDYAGMLAWAKFCAAGDKAAIAVETRKVLERTAFKSNRPERPRFYLGRVERMLGRDKEALRHFQVVLALKPNHAEAASEVRAIEARLQAASKGGTGLFGRKR
jgi:hypothetical protein